MKKYVLATLLVSALSTSVNALPKDGGGLSLGGALSAAGDCTYEGKTYSPGSTVNMPGGSKTCRNGTWNVKYVGN